MYFIYPETCGVRLEDMDSIFGDASTARGTPATVGTPSLRPEAGPLLRTASPVPSLDIRGRAPFGPANAIPGLDINPPDDVEVSDGRGQTSGGVTGWLSRIGVFRGQSPGASSRNGKYTPLNQGEE